MSSLEVSADRPVKDLVSALGHDLSLLVRQEIHLAKAEITEKALHTAKSAAKIGAGALLAYAGVLGVGAALVLLIIALGVVAWLAATIVALLFLLGGYVTAQSGRRSRLGAPRSPRR